MRVPFPLHPHQYLLLFIFLMVAILTGVGFDMHFLYGQECCAFVHVYFSHLTSSFEKEQPIRPYGTQ
jgi:hypothetical protein